MDLIVSNSTTDTVQREAPEITVAFDDVQSRGGFGLEIATVNVYSPTADRVITFHVSVSVNNRNNVSCSVKCHTTNTTKKVMGNWRTKCSQFWAQVFKR